MSETLYITITKSLQRLNNLCAHIYILQSIYCLLSLIFIAFYCSMTYLVQKESLPEHETEAGLTFNHALFQLVIISCANVCMVSECGTVLLHRDAVIDRLPIIIALFKNLSDLQISTDESCHLQTNHLWLILQVCVV